MNSPFILNAWLKAPAPWRQEGSQQTSSCLAYSLARGMRTSSILATFSLIFYSTPKQQPRHFQLSLPTPFFSPPLGQSDSDRSTQVEFQRRNQHSSAHQSPLPREERAAAGDTTFNSCFTDRAPVPPAPTQGSDGGPKAVACQGEVQGLLAAGYLKQLQPWLGCELLPGELSRAIINIHNLTHSSSKFFSPKAAFQKVHLVIFGCHQASCPQSPSLLTHPRGKSLSFTNSSPLSSFF